MRRKQLKCEKTTSDRAVNTMMYQTNPMLKLGLCSHSVMLQIGHRQNVSCSHIQYKLRFNDGGSQLERFLFHSPFGSIHDTTGFNDARFKDH